ncbi:MAG: alpha/beta hydrolase [Ignavibacteriales bacterium]
MKRIILLVVLLISFVFSGCSLNKSESTPIKKPDIKLQKQGYSYTKNEDKFFITEIISSPSLKNNKLGDPIQQEARVFLPPSYYSETEKRYPVVYYLHGFGSSFLEIDWYRNNYKSFVTNKKNKEFILVGVNGRNKLDGSFYVNSPVTGNWEDYIINDVVSFIDNKYKTIAMPSSRGISGFSMGGFGALSLGFHHPEIFSCIFAISPGIFERVDVKKVLTTWNSKIITAYGAAFAPNLDKPYPYVELPIFNNTSRDKIIITKWINGTGNFELKVSKYINNIRQLTGVQVAYGTKDAFYWIPNGCKNLSKSLTDKKIKNTLIEFDGNHGDKNNVIVDKYMFPYFSKLLKVQ